MICRLVILCVSFYLVAIICKEHVMSDVHELMPTRGFLVESMNVMRELSTSRITCTLYYLNMLVMSFVNFAVQ